MRWCLGYDFQWNFTDVIKVWFQINCDHTRRNLAAVTTLYNSAQLNLSRRCTGLSVLYMSLHVFPLWYRPHTWSLTPAMVIVRCLFPHREENCNVRYWGWGEHCQFSGQAGSPDLNIAYLGIVCIRKIKEWGNKSDFTKTLLGRKTWYFQIEIFRWKMLERVCGGREWGWQ